MISTGIENGNIGQSLLQRIGVRERERVQVKFLQLLKDTPLWEQMVFRGAVALHGVYLHGRCSKDLDFMASPEVSANFYEMANACGLQVQDKSEVTSVVNFSLPGQVFNRIVVGIDVCSRPPNDLPCQLGEFVSLSGQKIPVRVMPLREQIGEKLRAASRRGRALDFFDVWLAFEKHPNLLGSVSEVIEKRKKSDAPLLYDAEKALATLETRRDEWFEKLAPQMAKVPTFERVQQDLQCWLPSLAASTS